VADRPSEYFLGALDFFGILVPGAVSLVLLIAWYPRPAEAVAAIINLTGNERVIGFAVSAYLLGYLLHSSSAALDRLLDAVQQRSFERFYGRDIYQRARELKAQQLPEQDVSLIGTYRWALTSVRFLSPAWALELDRMAAHTALFRSMTLIVALTAIVQLGHKQWLASTMCAVLAAICTRIYQSLRWRNIRTVYEYYIALQSLSPKLRLQKKGERDEDG
jgi:hypothetical protein